MKTFNNLKSITIPTILILFLTLTLMGCLKKLDEVPQVSISGFSVIHAVPTAEKFDIYLGSTKVNILDFAFTNKIDYLNAYSGIRQVSVGNKNASAFIKTENFTLKPNIAYSLFVIGKPDSIKYLFLTDTLTYPPAGKAKIRFVNLSPDAGALNLAIGGATADLVADRLFKEYSPFITINNAERVTFNIKNKTTEVVEATLANVKIEDGKIYTVWAKGLKTATNDFKLGVEIFTHK